MNSKKIQILSELSFLVAFGVFMTPAAWAATEIDRYNSIHGVVAHEENEQGRSFLKFLLKGNNVPLPKEWKKVAIEQVIHLEGEGGQTAFLMSYSDASCSSRMSLAVVSKEVFWGPYAVGGCNDILIHQKSEDGNDFVAVRADKAGGKAWVYSSVNNSFKSAVDVTLPDGLELMVPEKDIKGSQPKPVTQVAKKPELSPAVATAPAPAASKPVDPARAKYGLADGEVVISTTKPAPKTVVVAVAPVVAPVAAPFAAPAPKPVAAAPSIAPSTKITPGNLSNSDAAKVAEQTRTAKPVTPIRLSL